MKLNLTHIKSASLITLATIFSFLLASCGGSSSNLTGSANDKKVSGKLLKPEGNSIYFGAFTNFGSHEDQVSPEKIQQFDGLAGKPIAWSYFSNNWNELNNNNEHSPTINYPSYDIDIISNLGKTPFVRLLPWTSPHQIQVYSNTARSSKYGNDLIAACVDPSNLSDLQNHNVGHKVTILISESEFTNKNFQIGSQWININGATKGPCFNDFSMQNIIDGDWDDDLRQWARDARDDRDESGNSIPLLVTFTVEMNGAWFPWSGIYNGGAKNEYKPEDGLADGPERYQDAYRHIIDLFREEDVDHITWFFAPDVFYPSLKWMPWITADWNLPESYYPGDDYIDWIGFTIYGTMKINKGADIPTSHEVFSEELSKKYHFIQNISQNKPYAILETGMVDHGDGSKSVWLSDMFDTLLNNPDYSNIKALNYWSDQSEDDDIIVNYNIDSSEETLTTFRQLIGDPQFISKLRFSQ